MDSYIYVFILSLAVVNLLAKLGFYIALNKVKEEDLDIVSNFKYKRLKKLAIRVDSLLTIVILTSIAAILLKT